MLGSIGVSIGIYGLGFIISVFIAMLINGLLKLTQLIESKEKTH